MWKAPKFQLKWVILLLIIAAIMLMTCSVQRGPGYCALHNMKTKSQIVKTSYGLPSKDFLKARKQTFPNSAWNSGGCVVDLVPHFVLMKVCPSCKSAEDEWGAKREAELE